MDSDIHVEGARRHDKLSPKMRALFRRELCISGARLSPIPINFGFELRLIVENPSGNCGPRAPSRV